MGFAPPQGFGGAGAVSTPSQYGRTFPSELARALNYGGLGTATETVYTCPTGKIAVLDAIQAWNTTASAITFNVYIVPNGGTAGAGNQLTAATISAGIRNGVGGPVVLNPGDTIQVSGSAAGLNVFGRAFEYLPTEPITAATFLNMAAAVTTIFTCPTGKTAMPMNFANDALCAVIFNPTASSITLSASVTPSGGSSYVIQSGLSVAAGGSTTLGNSAVFAGFNSGDALSVTPSAAGLNLWGAFITI